MPDLLELLQLQTGCCYLSDLHHSPFRERALAEALRLCPSEFPLCQWQEAIRYLLNPEEVPSSIEDVFSLLNHFEKHFR